jgi:glycosyltransferase involved in cell wall biosynthesis
MKLINEHPKVTAIVCAFNEETTIHAVMQVLVNHPLIEEVIAVDDGSQDHTGIILSKFHNPGHVQSILLANNYGKGNAMATAASIASGEILLFLDADLKNLSSHHISTMLSTFLNEEADMLIGFPIRGKTITAIEKLDPFQHLSGQRVLYRRDFLPLIDSIRTSGYGVETILNNQYNKHGKSVKSIFLPFLIHPIKVEKAGFRKAMGEYILEGKQIVETQLKNRQVVKNRGIVHQSTIARKDQRKSIQTLLKLSRKIVSRPTIIFSEPISMDEPVIFVANHEKNYGPSIMQLFFPIPYHPWIIYNMLDVKECYPYVQETFFKQRLGWPTWLSRVMAKAIAATLVRIMHFTHPVPVYREKPDQIIETFRQSMDILKNGENILIFPENGDSDSYSAEVNQFYDGFIYLAKLYYRQTQKSLVFYPVSINPESHMISVGRMVRFNPFTEYKLESERIRQNLMQQVAYLYHNPWLPKGYLHKRNESTSQPELQTNPM